MTKKKMRNLTLVLVALTLGSCVEEGPYIGKDCPPNAATNSECRQGDLNKNCRELIPGHNVVNISEDGKLAKDRINFVFTAISRTPDEAYLIFREGIRKLTLDDFFRNNGSLINYWYVSKTSFMERGDPFNYGEEGREASTLLAEECPVENKFPLNYQHWTFAPNADLSMSFLNTLSDKEMRAVINARKYAPNDDSCGEVVEECWGGDCIFNQFFSEEEYTLNVARNLICNLGYSSNSARFSWPTNGLVFTHEIGHSVFGLYDEYDYGPTVDTQVDWIDIYKDHPVNCFVGTYDQCIEGAPWKKHIGKIYRQEIVGCYEGCGLESSGIFRATEYSVMKNTWLTHGYGLPSEIRACNVIALLTNRASETCKKIAPVLKEL